MQRHRLLIVLALVFCSTKMFAGSYTFADSYTFSTIPLNGSIAGPPGSTIGWGYSITNDSSVDWLVTASLTSFPFLHGTPDASPFDFPIIPPNTTVTVPYNQVTNTGLFALTWDSNAPIGFNNSGLFTLGSEWWSGDPFNGGMFLGDAPDETAAYSATVSSPSPLTEPSFFPTVLGGGLAVFLKFGSKRWKRC